MTGALVAAFCGGAASALALLYLGIVHDTGGILREIRKHI